MKLLTFKKLNKYSAGFTLIEILLSLSITSFILIMTTIFLSTLLESRVKNQTMAEVEQQGIYVMQMIAQTTRNASTINAPATGVSSGTLSLNTITPALNPTIFDLASGAIRIKEAGGGTIDLTNSRVTASGLTFHNLSRAATPGSIRMTFTLTYNNNTGRNEYSFSKTFTSGASLRQP
ncbi:MAG: prepilin-type N-terminal cleavage/methylation domain-containing protein [bacterium]|nr:prepilin-type N-terminal cleavage/methylation domain-containing protein [bacterium]